MAGRGEGRKEHRELAASWRATSSWEREGGFHSFQERSQRGEKCESLPLLLAPKKRKIVLCSMR
jgi:hypothetical protein